MQTQPHSPSGFFSLLLALYVFLSSCITRCAGNGTSEKDFQATPHPIVPVSSQSPTRFYSWDLPSESGSVSSSGSSPEIPRHTITGYNYYRSDDQLPWGFPGAGDQQEARSHPLECPLDLTFAQSPSIGDPRIILDRLYPRIRAFGVVYTDDAKMKLGEGVRRRCFNCKAIETTTWRRSSLSPGKLVRLHHQPYNLSNVSIALQ